MASRFQIATGSPTRRATDAVERAVDLLKMPADQVPQKAKDYAGGLCSRFGGCMEVLVTAYAHYAQAVEGLPCADNEYTITDEGIAWFGSHVGPGEKARLAPQQQPSITNNMPSLTNIFKEVR